MNNKELITELSARAGVSQQSARKMVMTVVDNLLTRAQNEGSVQVPGFGTFEVKKRLERIIVSPGTGKKMLVPPKLTFAFRPTTAWKGQLQKGDSQDEQD